MANNKMLIDASHPEETRVAMVRGNRVDEFDFESEHKTQLRGNIYLAKVTRVEPSLQAAFVDYGGNRHGFLAFNEIHPDYYQIPVADRQALLDAEEEEARLAAAEDETDNDNDGESGEEALQEDSKETKRPTRKRRSKRKSSKKSTESTDAETLEADTDTDTDTGTDNDGGEESDDDDTIIAAENDGEDVVSQSAEGDTEEPAKKPRRRVSRPKKTATKASDAENTDNETSAPADASTQGEEKEVKKPVKRRTSRKKAEPTETVETVAEPAADDAEPVKKKRRTSRKKAAEPAVEETVEANAEASNEAEPVKKPRRTSRKKVVKDATPETNTENEANIENNEVAGETSAPIEASTAQETTTEQATSVPQAAVKKPRRTTRRVKPKASDEAASTLEEAKQESVVEEPVKADVENTAATEVAAEESTTGRKPRRRTSRVKAKPQTQEADTSTDHATTSAAEDKAPALEKSAETDTTENDQSENTGDTDVKAKEEKPTRNRRSRSRKNKKDSEASEQQSPETDTSASNDDEEEAIEDLGQEDVLDDVTVRRAPRKNYKIQEVIKRRQILLVQVVKEERGNKGAALTTYLSLAGRYSVLMPNTARGGGISRKITNTSDRKRLKSVASKLAVPQGMGVILRTAGASQPPEEIQRDFEYLMRLWENVRTLTLESQAPCLVYEEGNLIKRSIRDLYDKNTGEILVAGEKGFKEAKAFMAMLMPDQAKNVKQYSDVTPLFARMGVETQLDAMLQSQVTLKSGGYLIIDQTEALVAIDVNSGRSTRQHSIEDTATQTNLEAADEVARQLRLRDLAGLIVIDFIDMEDRRNIRNVEKRLKDALKSDRARIQVGRISHFGLLEMSRQRIRASVLESTTQTCPTCGGLGHVRSASSIALGVLRSIEEQLKNNSRNDLTVMVHTETALYLLNNKREALSDIETRFGVSLDIQADNTLGTQPCVIEKGAPSKHQPSLESAVQPDSIEAAPSAQEAENSDEDNSDNNGENNSDGRKKRRRRRRKKGGEQTEQAENATDPNKGDENAAAGTDNDAVATKENSTTDDTAPKEAKGHMGESVSAPKRTIRRRRRKEEDTVSSDDAPSDQTSSSNEAQVAPSQEEVTQQNSAPTSEGEQPKAEKKRGSWWQRKFF